MYISRSSDNPYRPVFFDSFVSFRLPSSMHFSAAVVLSSIFTLTLALPAPQSGSKAPAPGRLNVNYNFNKQTLSSGSKASSNGLSMIKASAPFTIKAYNSESPIHMMDINVSYNKFWVGNATNSTCPEDRPGNPPQPCPVGNITALLTTSTGGAQMVRLWYSIETQTCD